MKFGVHHFAVSYFVLKSPNDLNGRFVKLSNCCFAKSTSHVGARVKTALLCVQNDTVKATDKHKVTLLVLHDLSNAFDPVVHKVLLRRLSQDVGVAHHALRWFTSYMSDSTQSVHIHDASSPVRPLHMVSPKARCSAPSVFYIHSACCQDHQQVQSDVPPLCRGHPNLPLSETSPDGRRRGCRAY